MLRVSRVLESCLYAEDLALAATFYGEVLGLPVLSSVDDRHVFFRCGDGMFLLFNPERTWIPDGEVPPHGARGAGHIAFAVPADELPAWRTRLEGLRVPIEAEVAWPRGGSSLYLRDPAGNSVELTSPAIWGIDEEQSRPP